VLLRAYPNPLHHGAVDGGVSHRRPAVSGASAVTSLMSQRFVAVVAAIRSALHLRALSRMSKQRNLNAEEFSLCEAADSVILEAVAESPERVAPVLAALFAKR